MVAVAGVQIQQVRSQIDDLYATLGEALIDGLVVSDAHHRVIYANSSFCQLLGYTLNEIQGQPLANFLDADGMSLLAEQIDNVLTPESVGAHLKWGCKKGQKVIARVFPLLSENLQAHDVVLFAVTSPSVPDEHEQLSLNSVASMGSLLQASFIEQCGKIIASNGPVAEIVGTDNDDQAVATLLALLESRAAGLAEPIRLRKNDGKVGWVQLSCSQIDCAGEAARLGSIVDVTPHRRLERRMRAAQFKQIGLLDKLDASHEAERKRIANDLHDGLGAYLSSLKFQMERFIDDPTYSDRSHDCLAKLIPNIQSAIEQMRNCIMALRPPLLDDLGLAATLECITREFESMHGSIQVESHIAIDEFSMGDKLSTIIYRLVQEALSNIAKHAQANRVVIVLKQREGRVQLSIRDNGDGFSLKEVYARTRRSSGLGLCAMKERVDLSGGRFSISTELGSGTLISANWKGLQTATEV